jgi:bifunctional DNA-binding transcriptional regulator/antitoxin component of YhaV-PrlF toxin-antitoxin module
MSDALSTARVSSDGRITIPMALRRRWGLDGGSEVTLVDMGSAALLVPSSAGTQRRARARLLHEGGYERGLAQIDDPDLADQ